MWRGGPWRAKECVAPSPQLGECCRQGAGSISRCACFAPIEFHFSVVMRPRFPDACGVFLERRGLSEPAGRVPQPPKERPVRILPRCARAARVDGLPAVRAPGAQRKSGTGHDFAFYAATFLICRARAALCLPVRLAGLQQRVSVIRWVARLEHLLKDRIRVGFGTCRA